jgi:hypothetical protein
MAWLAMVELTKEGPMAMYFESSDLLAPEIGDNELAYVSCEVTFR